MTFDSPSLIVILTILFVVVGVGSSLIYYFARYYFKTDHDDKELLTKRPLSIGVEQEDSAKSEFKSSRITDVQLEQKPPRKSLSDALAKTKNQFWGRLSLINWSFGQTLTPQMRDEIEEILFTSDIGPAVAERLLNRLQDGVREAGISTLDDAKAILKNELLSCFKDRVDLFARQSSFSKPAVWMVVGINGAGKTTTIGKLASLAKTLNLKVMIVAGDTFRAAADSQLKVWAERVGCEIYSAENTKDPGAVAYAGLERAKASGVDLVIIDTAGRLHTQDHLMDELKKIRRVVSKLDATAPHERIIVLDANAGQNALEQARQFHNAIDLTSVVVTKMDGSSKAGIVVGVAQELQLPISFIGIGEAVEDLRPFEPGQFVEAIL